MATCKDCLHVDVCEKHCEEQNVEGCSVCMFRACIYTEKAESCPQFTDKSPFVELPCEIGDVVYMKIGDDETPCFVDSGEVFAIGIDENEIMWISARYESGLKYYHASDDIGKTVFLTREEAERALEVQK